MTSTFWRISNYPTLNGIGGLKYSARWNTAGRPVVYLAASPPGALVETLAHLDSEQQVPDTYTLLQVEADESLSIEELTIPVNKRWKENPALTGLLGDQWLARMQTPLAKVPSVIVPQTWNYLLNPLHPDAAKLRIVATFVERYDLRLLHIKRS